MKRTSRTTEPDGAPYRWENFVASTGARVVENELEDCLQERCRTQSEYELFTEEIKVRKDRAAAGKLGTHDQPPPDPVVSQPALWEVRWSFGGERELRLYHAEPSKDPQLLLAVKYHWKLFDGKTASEVEAAQNAAMKEGGDRFRSHPLHHRDDERLDPPGRV